MLTTQEIFKEYTKCLVNPSYAIETYLETFDKTQGPQVKVGVKENAEIEARSALKVKFELTKQPVDFDHFACLDVLNFHLVLLKNGTELSRNAAKGTNVPLLSCV